MNFVTYDQLIEHLQYASNRKTNISITHPLWLVKSDHENSNVPETAFFLHLSKLVFYNHPPHPPLRNRLAARDVPGYAYILICGREWKLQKGKLLNWNLAVKHMVKSPDIPLNPAGSHFQKLYYLFFPFYNTLSKVRPDSSSCSCSSLLLGCRNLDYLLDMQSRNWSNQIISSHLFFLL